MNASQTMQSSLVKAVQAQTLLLVVQVGAVHTAIDGQDSDVLGRGLPVRRGGPSLRGAGGLQLKGGQLQHGIVCELVCLHCKPALYQCIMLTWSNSLTVSVQHSDPVKLSDFVSAAI